MIEKKKTEMRAAIMKHKSPRSRFTKPKLKKINDRIGTICQLMCETIFFFTGVPV